MAKKTIVKERAAFEIKEGDIVLRPVPETPGPGEVAFHIYNMSNNEIVGHMRWTSKGLLKGKYVKRLYHDAQPTDEE